MTHARRRCAWAPLKEAAATARRTAKLGAAHEETAAAAVLLDAAQAASGRPGETA